MQVNLVIAEWNANGILNHINEIGIFLQTNFIDILLISETHFTDRSFFRLNGYDIVMANHPDNKAHGGAAILIKSNIKYEEAEPIKQHFLQAAGVKIICDNMPVSIYSVYIPPRHTVKCDKFDNFFSRIGNKFIVGGDFNAKHPWWGSRLTNPKGSELYKCICNNHYDILSTGAPTYWPSDPNKLPDLLDFIIFKGIPMSSLDIVANYDLSSDHSPVIVNYSTTPIKRTKNRKLFSNKTDIDYFQHIIDQNISLNIRIKTGVELDEAIKSFTNLVHEAANLSTPDNIVENMASFKISHEIRCLIRRKRRLRKIWQRTRNPVDKTNFNRAANFLKRRLKEQKHSSTNSFLRSLCHTNNNEYNLWKATRYLKRPQRRNVAIKDTSGVWCRSDQSKASSFKTFLEETFKPFSFCTDSDRNEVKEFLDIPCQMYRPIKPFSFKEVLNEIRKLNSKKSAGFDLIDAKVLKSLPKKGYIYLTTLFNSILRLTYYPADWKLAKIIMVLKPNKQENNIASYRPISLLPTMSKVFERLLQKRLLPILDALNILPDHQFGFRHGHGTSEQCHRVVKTIRESLEKKQYCSAVFLDVKQAFDRVWHDGLLYKLKLLLPTPYYLLLKSYLDKRKFFVNINEENSEIGVIQSGVPQGSVLGPVLYTLYTSDFPTSDSVTIATYADDTAILASNICPVEASKAIQNQLNNTQSWLNKWNIKVNAEKSIHVTFTLRKEECPAVVLNSVIIPKSNCVKYLGLNMDRRLTWKQHITLKRKQLNIKTKKMYWLLGPKSQLSLENKVILYKSILKPIWTYGIELWGTASNSNVEILQRYQSKSLRLITNSPWFVNNNNIHSDLGVPKVKTEIRRYSNNYLNRLSQHSNVLAIALLDSSDETRRLKRLHVLDLPFLN